jgi:hypothetical protein
VTEKNTDEQGYSLNICLRVTNRMNVDEVSYSSQNIFPKTTSPQLVSEHVIPKFSFNLRPLTLSYAPHCPNTKVGKISKLKSHDEIKIVIIEDLTAVTINNAVFWDMRTQFVPNRRHIMSHLQGPTC